MVHEADGGYTTWCDPGTACDNVTERCLRKRAAGQSCGPGLGQCSLGCGHICSNVDGGAGTCVPLPTAGQPCVQNLCAPGHCCTMRYADGGFTMEGSCEAQAGDREECGSGYNFDALVELAPYYADMYVGGWSYFAPVCAVGLVCDIPGGNYLGLCRPATAQPSGHACITGPYPPDTCAVAAEVCRPSPDGGSTFCLPRAAAGQPCTSDDQCQPGMPCLSNPLTGGSTCVAPGQAGQPCADGHCATGHWCQTTDGGASTCLALVPDGGVCDVDEACAGDYMTCLHARCTPRLTADYDDLPLCQ